MNLPRSAGILLHPTSLPGPGGIGSLGAEAHRFIDWLAAAGQSWWQMLPLGPTAFGNSPYAAYSAFAGNPSLIDLEDLVAEGLLEAADLAGAPADAARVDYEAVVAHQRSRLERAFSRFEELAPPEALEAFAAFMREHASWLDDYACFMAFKDAHAGAAWAAWEPGLRDREPAALAAARGTHARAIRFHQFLQFLFFAQFRALKRHASEQGVGLIGDLPIFVAYDSADAWSHRELFHLDAEGHPLVVAGVPPDYFSETGQLWGNPLYRWDAMARDGYRWWIARMQMALAMFDLVRIDHFRGFEAYWEIPAGEPTAIHGRWVPGPGSALFETMRLALGDLPIIAEDLGVITPEVEALRDGLALPGMKILQFAFGTDAENAYLPHNHVANCVVYTGTHDNDTSRGWATAASDEERAYFQAYAPGVEPASQRLIRLALGSVAHLAVIPMQDWLDLDTDSRMNVPGEAKGNWGWRMAPEAASDLLRKRIKQLTSLYGR